MMEVPNLTNGGQRMYDELPAIWKYSIDRCMRYKEDGHDQIGPALNIAGSDDVENREQAYEYLNYFFDHWDRIVDQEFRQQQYSNLVSEIREKRKQHKQLT